MVTVFCTAGLLRPQLSVKSVDWLILLVGAELDAAITGYGYGDIRPGEFEVMVQLPFTKFDICQKS